MMTGIGSHAKNFLKIGPIVRINPEELSIHDPNFYNEIYVTESRRRTSNYDVFCKGIDFDGENLHVSS